MYEDQTFEVILKRMLARVPNNVDKREGSIIYDALAPAAAELTQAYIEMDVILNETFADTATRQFLIRRAAERGMNPETAKKAVLKGMFLDSSGAPFDVPINSRFSLDVLRYTVKKKLSSGIFSLECETAGEIGNTQFGPLIPIQYIPGLATGELTEILIPGEDEEDTEMFRKRYFDSLEAEAYGGNIADYKQKVEQIQGVGGVNVYPTWDGGGTVKLVIIDSEYNVPSWELIDTVQTAMDPEVNQGKGLGIAPIGHVVTVEGVETVSIDISFNLVFEEGFGWVDVKEAVIETLNEYFLELRKVWAEETALVLRISQVDVRILDIAGVLDIENTAINGEAQNLILENDKIPVLGEVTAG